MSSINTRLKQIIHHKSLTPNQIGEVLGMTAIYVRKLTNEGASFGIEPIKKILISFPEINARWFLTGEGEMLNGDMADITHSSPITPERLLSIIESQQRTIENLSKK